MSNVQSLRPFYSSQNPLNSSLTLKELLLVFFNIQYRALLSCNLNLVCIIYAPSDPEKNVSYCCPFTQKLHFFLGNLVDRPYQNDTFVTICNESLRTCSFRHTWGVYIGLFTQLFFSSASVFPNILNLPTENEIFFQENPPCHTSKIASLTVEYRYELYLLDSLSKIKQSKLLNFKICQKSHVFLQYCQIQPLIKILLKEYSK